MKNNDMELRDKNWWCDKCKSRHYKGCCSKDELGESIRAVLAKMGGCNGDYDTECTYQDAGSYDFWNGTIEEILSLISERVDSEMKAQCKICWDINDGVLQSDKREGEDGQ